MDAIIAANPNNYRNDANYISLANALALSERALALAEQREAFLETYIARLENFMENLGFLFRC